MNNFTINDMYIGMKESFSVSVSDEDMLMFKKITGDNNPMHCSDEYAVANNQPKRIAYGLLTASYLSTLAGVYLPGERSLIHSVEFKCKAPVYPGDKLLVEGTVTDINTDFNFIILKCRIYNQDNVCVLRGGGQVGIRE